MVANIFSISDIPTDDFYFYTTDDFKSPLTHAHGQKI